MTPGDVLEVLPHDGGGFGEQPPPLQAGQAGPGWLGGPGAGHGRVHVLGCRARHLAQLPARPAQHGILELSADLREVSQCPSRANRASSLLNALHGPSPGFVKVHCLTAVKQGTVCHLGLRLAKLPWPRSLGCTLAPSSQLWGPVVQEAVDSIADLKTGEEGE